MGMQGTQGAMGTQGSTLPADADGVKPNQQSVKQKREAAQRDKAKADKARMEKAPS